MGSLGYFKVRVLNQCDYQSKVFRPIIFKIDEWIKFKARIKSPLKFNSKLLGNSLKLREDMAIFKHEESKLDFDYWMVF